MMNNGFAGNYRPDLLPGHAPNRPDVDSAAAPSRSTSMAPVESRLHSILANSSMVGADSMLRAFLQSDVPYLMRIARAADRWAHAINAESSRRAAEEVHAAVRSR